MKPAFEERPLKYVASINDNALPETTDPDHEIKYIDIGNVDAQGNVHEVAVYRFSKAPSRARRKVQHGDVIISTVRTYLQAISSIKEPEGNLVVSTGFAVVRPVPGILNDDYFKYAVRNSYFLWEVEAKSKGISYPAINSSELAGIKIPLPSLDIQKRIADYLDRETAEIDALVAEKERMLALLEEKRQALISHVVTRGLDLNTPLKPSGIDWLGDIPQHWITCQLKRTWKSSDYGISENIRGEGDVRVLRMTCIEDGIVNLSQGGEVESVDPWLLLEKEDLLFNRTNSLDQIAKVGIVKSAPEQLTTFASYLVRIRTNDLVTPEFLAIYLNSQVFLAFARKNAIPAIGQANLSPSRYGAIKIALPPRSEQLDIVDFIEAERTRTTELEKDLTHSITLLKERRSALITAAVTGQIDLEDIVV